jgi:hypothetical protein
LFVVRGTLPDHSLLQSLRSAVRTHLPSAALQDAGPLAQELAGDLYALRLLAVGMCCIGAIGGAIALSGVYSVASYQTARRAREVGIKVALGATGRQLYAQVLRETAVVMLGGVVGGVLAAAPIGFIIRSLVSTVRILDPLAMAVVLIVFLTVALCAAALPLNRMVSRDPSLALRER